VLLLFAYIYIIVRGPNIKVGGGRWYLISPDYPTTFFYKIFYRKLKMEQQEPPLKPDESSGAPEG